MLRECVPPARLPQRALTQRDVERFWITDRQSLIDCAKRKGALQDFYAERDRLVAGGAG